MHHKRRRIPFFGTMKDIIIVEDRSSERERLQKLFEGAEYETIACASVAEAQQSFKQGGFRLAILDIGLDDRSGSFLFHEIRTNHSDCEVIIFTGNPSVHLKQRFLQEGAVDYIVKGTHEAQGPSFLARVRSLIGAGGNRRPSGLPLQEFVERCLSRESKPMFRGKEEGSEPRCEKCDADTFTVVFNHENQFPPHVNGIVQCAQCGQRLEPRIG